jgi:predicted dehydrogenase
MQKTKIAIAGAGTMGLEHIAVISQSDDCELVAIVDTSPAVESIAAIHRVPWHKTLDALFEDDVPDGIILATPNHMHVPQAIQCISAGIPILLEKPIATTVHEAQMLVDVVERTRACVLIGHHRAHSPIMIAAHKIVQSGKLGRLVSVTGSATFFKPDQYFDEAPWRREIGAGPLLINMIHEIHNLRTLCGDIVAVQAFKSDAVRGFAVEDTAAINLRFANGALGSFMLSDTAACARSWEQTSQENAAYAHCSNEDCYVIAGTHGSLSIPTMRVKTYPSERTRSWAQPFDESTVAVSLEDPLARQMAHFVRVIRNEVKPLVSARDGLNNLRVTEAISRAANSGETVWLSNPQPSATN